MCQIPYGAALGNYVLWCFGRSLVHLVCLVCRCIALGPLPSLCLLLRQGIYNSVLIYATESLWLYHIVFGT